MSVRDKKALLAKAGFAYAGSNESSASGAPRREDPSASDSEGNASYPGLTREELDSMPLTPASDGEPVCVLCYTNKVNVMFQPCGHAQLCSRCTAEVLRMSFSGCCPVCRQPIARTSRIYL